MVCVIAGFGRVIDQNCALLGCYAASSGNSLQTFREKPVGPLFNLEIPSWILYLKEGIFDS